MKKLFELTIVILQISFLSLLISCSNSENPDEKGLIEQKQDKIAHEATTAIKTPIDKAKVAAELSNEHARRVEDVQQQ